MYGDPAQDIQNLTEDIKHNITSLRDQVKLNIYIKKTHFFLKKKKLVIDVAIHSRHEKLSSRCTFGNSC